MMLPIDCRILALATFALFSTSEIFAADAARINASTIVGTIRPLHGVNNGPLNQGETVDVSAAWKRLSIPSTRLHDSEWPAADMVDIHAVFPNLFADPESPDSYRFERTDDYMKPIVASGSGIVYRLGESIEHTRRKHYVHPPRDYARWSQACLGIIRHYNEGWAGGHHHQIRYWEIWNEPENRPSMWSGTDADYIRLYVTAARTIKLKYPDLKVGGPACGSSGEMVDGKYVPTEFLRDFVKTCREEKVPLDFFSWHTYTNDPAIYAAKAHGIRRWLDAEGFPKAEIHLNEWNFLPGNDWGPMLNTAEPKARDRWYASMAGLPGATFVTSVLISLQDSPIDVANYYSGDSSPFGLFERFGTPKKTYYGFLAFRKMLDTPNRVQVTGTNSKADWVLAGVNMSKTELQVLVSHQSTTAETWPVVIEQLPWSGPSEWQVLHLNESLDLEGTSQGDFEATDQPRIHQLPDSGVVLLKLKKK